MELRHLRYFVAVAEEQNVTRAAARLHVSQPPLSRQIRDLEDELGLPLLERTAKSVRLTDAGRLFLREARAVLARCEQAVRAVRSRAAGGTLRIGYAPSPTAGLLPAALQEFGRRAPGVKVKLLDATSPQMLAGLRARTLDVALLTEPARGLLRGLSFERLATYPVGVAVAPGHPLARRRGVTVADLAREPLVAYSRRDFPDYHTFLARTLGPAARRLRIVEECDSGLSLVLAVEAGVGVAVTASSLAHIAGGRVRLLPLRPAPPPLVVGLAHRPGALDVEPLRRFAACVRAAAAVRR